MGTTRILYEELKKKKDSDSEKKTGLVMVQFRSNNNEINRIFEEFARENADVVFHFVTDWKKVPKAQANEFRIYYNGSLTSLLNPPTAGFNLKEGLAILLRGTKERGYYNKTPDKTPDKTPAKTQKSGIFKRLGTEEIKKPGNTWYGHSRGENTPEYYVRTHVEGAKAKQTRSR